MAAIKIFISSVQAEFSRERRMLYDYIRQDALLGQFFEPFIFEKLPSADISAQQAYLSEAARSDIYLGILGQQYGNEDPDGISPTEREYRQATENHRYRIAFIKRATDRHPKQQAFIEQVQSQLVRKSFADYEELRTAVYSSLVRYLEEKEILRKLPFDATAAQRATWDDIDPQKVRTFIEKAREKRHPSFRTRPAKVLPHLRSQMRTVLRHESRETDTQLSGISRDAFRTNRSGSRVCNVSDRLHNRNP